MFISVEEHWILIYSIFLDGYYINRICEIHLNAAIVELLRRMFGSVQCIYATVSLHL